MTESTGGPVADLHVHTTTSDGLLTYDEIPALATDAGLRAVAVTDHDRLNPDFDAPVEVIDGVTLIRGIELKVELPSGDRIDLLGYGVRETPELCQLIDDLQANRRERGRAIIEKVESQLGIELGLQAHEGIGRPHIARAVADHPEADLTYRGVFDELIGDDGPCFVARHIPSLEAGVDTLSAACPLVAVAHPLRYADVDVALAVASDLGAVERWYPYDESVSFDRLDRTIREGNLVATGGSDAHEKQLGVAGPSADDYERFRTACGFEDQCPPGL